MVTVPYADDGEGTTAMTRRGNESVINAYIVENDTVVGTGGSRSLIALMHDARARIST
jgi:hypothetical protein